MTTVLAGLVGGLLALIGGALVQARTARAARRERIAKLGAEVLANGAFAVDDLYQIMRTGDADAHSGALADVRFLPEAITATSELSLIGSPALSQECQAVSGAMNQLVLLTIPGRVSRAEWQAAAMIYGAARLQMMHAIRKDLGQKAMTDDQLGHDPPDIEDPKSTHTP